MSERRHAGTVKGISARIRVVNSHGDIGPRKVEEVIAGRDVGGGHHCLSMEEWGLQQKIGSRE